MPVRLVKDSAPAAPDAATPESVAALPDKVESPAQSAASRPISLRKPAAVGRTTEKDVHAGASSAPTPVPTVSPAPPERRSPAGPAGSGRRFGRLALTAAFTLGAMLTGAIGYAVAASLNSDLIHAKARLVSSGQTATELRSQLERTTSQLDTARSELASTRSQLAQAQSEAADVEERASRVEAQEAELEQRAAALVKQEKRLNAEEASVQAREAALASFDVGHPLLESISDDGTWVVGRDIKPGTWTSYVNGTGCTWHTSDGRSGAGQRSYDDMRVHLEPGQTFTVHGCSLWSNYGY